MSEEVRPDLRELLDLERQAQPSAAKKPEAATPSSAAPPPEGGGQAAASPSSAPREGTLARLLQWRVASILTARYVELKLADLGGSLILIAQAPLIGYLIRLAFDGEKETLRLQFVLAMVAVWFGTFNACREVVKERLIFLRERRTGVPVRAYLLSKITGNVRLGRGKNSILVYRVIFLCFVVLGTVSSLGNVIDFSDLAILSMAFPNIIGGVLLARGVKERLDAYWASYQNDEFKVYK